MNTEFGLFYMILVSVLSQIANAAPDKTTDMTKDKKSNTTQDNLDVLTNETKVTYPYSFSKSTMLPTSSHSSGILTDAGTLLNATVTNTSTEDRVVAPLVFPGGIISSAVKQNTSISTGTTIHTPEMTSETSSEPPTITKVYQTSEKTQFPISYTATGKPTNDTSISKTTVQLTSTSINEAQTTSSHEQASTTPTDYLKNYSETQNENISSLTTTDMTLFISNETNQTDTLTTISKYSSENTASTSSGETIKHSTKSPIDTSTVLTHQQNSTNIPLPLHNEISTSKSSNKTDPERILITLSDGDLDNSDAFWPIAMALTIGVPTIVVFAVTITVLYRRRLSKPRGLLSLYGEDYAQM